MSRPILLALCCSLILPAIASASTPILPEASSEGATAAYRLGGSKWPQRTITYASSLKGEDDEWALRRAVSAWNSSGVRIRFQRVRPSRAALRIVYSSRLSGGAFGEASLGWMRSRDVVVQGGRRWRGPHVWLRSPDRRESYVTRWDVSVVLAHELGHVVGLNHHHSVCGVMSYERATRCAAPPNPWQTRCRLLEPDDLAGARRRYGGRTRLDPVEFCDREPAPAPIADLSGIRSPNASAVTLAWNSSAGTGTRVLVRSFSCDRLGGSLVRAVLESTPGPQTWTDTAPPTSSDACYSLTTLDRYGRESAATETLVPRPPA